MTDDDIAALAILLGYAPEEYDGRCKHCYHDTTHTAKEHAASVAAYIDTEKTQHEAAAGAKCHAGPDGFCLTCGVEMTVCNVCNGIGYHREGCPTMPESFDYARCEALRTALGKRGLVGELFAACNCVLYGSDSERAAARELLSSNAARIADIEANG